MIGKKNNQSSVSDAEQEIPTIGSTDDAGIIRFPSGWEMDISIKKLWLTTNYIML